ncbi:MAG: hypothetical protein QM775_25065 [Pirellulales bacterium]
MSGDSQRNDDNDFLDDDFVVEDLAGKNDDLEQLFDDPRQLRAKAGEPTGVPDSDDVLFTDHSAGLEGKAQFAGREPFDERAGTTWQGDRLDLDGPGAAAADGQEELAEAEAAFAKELGSMLNNEEEDGLDSDKELELVDGPTAGDGISEIEQSGPFVLDDGDGTWQERQTAASGDESPAAAEADIVVGDGDDSPEQPVEPEVAEAIWEAVKEPAMAEQATDEAAQEPGWEPLPESNVDELSEVEEVTEADAVPADAELAAVEGHDIYGDDAPVLVGPRGGRSQRSYARFAAIAASLALVGGAAVVVMRPEWVGLTFEAEPVQQVSVARPRLELALAPPPANRTPLPQVGIADPGKGTGEPVPTKDPVASTLPGTHPDVGANPTSDPSAPVYGPEVPTAVASTATGETTPQVSALTPAPGTATTPAIDWPVAQATPPALPAGPRPKKGTLVRVGDNTMVGDMDGRAKEPRVQPVEGVLPGTRAFAQLQNGNYFIGSIKVADADKVTLRLGEGEVTLSADEVVRLTALGSADYEALQKATSGFVRLTNNNKLVGGILKQIADSDDHIVLEFRSNRVILPKAVVGQVVQGEAEQEVRLDVTPQEDNWVRTIAERQLGGTAQAAKGAPMQVTPLPKDAPKDPAKDGAKAPTPKPTPAKPAPARSH